MEVQLSLSKAGNRLHGTDGMGVSERPQRAIACPPCPPTLHAHDLCSVSVQTEQCFAIVCSSFLALKECTQGCLIQAIPSYHDSVKGVWVGE